MKSSELTSYAHTPYTTPLTRHTLPDGTTEYRTTGSDRSVDVTTDSLFDLLQYALERFTILVDMLSNDDYQRFSHLFKALIRDVDVTIHEANHFIEQNVGEIKIVSINERVFMHRSGAVVDAMLKREHVNKNP